MSNPNHPVYGAHGGGSNAHLLENVLFTTEPHKQTIVQQFAYEPLSVHQVNAG